MAQVLLFGRDFGDVESLCCGRDQSRELGTVVDVRLGDANGRDDVRGRADHRVRFDPPGHLHLAAIFRAEPASASDRAVRREVPFHARERGRALFHELS